MTTTVYFATNRQVANSADAIDGYPAEITKPLRPQDITYGTALVDGGDIQTNAQGNVTSITQINKGEFGAATFQELSNAPKDLLVFIHGFANTFSDAITRAALNRDWMAASGLPSTDTTVIAFCWPSEGRVVGPVLPEPYLRDQHMAGNSGLGLMSFFSRLQPIIDAVHVKGKRVTLLAHSMGNLALQAAVASWFLNGNGEARMFDLTVLAAGDCRYDTFDLPNLAGLRALEHLGGRIAILYSNADHVLQLSMAVNLGAKRLGQDGPHNRADPVSFPVPNFQMIDCTKTDDYDVGFMTSHQYYRLSPSVRTKIAEAIAAAPMV